MVSIVAGTRPEVIKLFPVWKELKKKRINVCWISTGQHRDLQKQALDFFGIIPDVVLSPVESQSVAELTAKLILQLSEHFSTMKLKCVVVQGDTATTLAAAQSAFFHKIKIVYVEAGLRSFDLTSPFPEEGNRLLVSQIADVFCTPTSLERDNLLAEGIADEKIFVTGNTVVDSLRWVQKKLRQKVLKPSTEVVQIVEQVEAAGKKLVLFTLHRRESLSGLASVVLLKVEQVLYSAEYQTCFFLYISHPNPAFTFVRDFFSRSEFADRCKIIPPQDYLDMVFLLTRAQLVLSDSGGIFEEASSLAVPTLCLREKSERFYPQLQNIAFLVGEGALNFEEGFKSAYSHNFFENKNFDLFGDGQAGQKIVNVLQLTQFF